MNELIAEFMNLEKGDIVTCVDGSNMCRTWEEQGYLYHGVNHSVSGLRYKYSWDWLIPVVEKIESLSWGIEVEDNSKTQKHAITIEVEILLNSCTIEVISYLQGDRGISDVSTLVVISQTGKTKRETVYNTVIEFIKYYNKYIK